MKKLMAIFLIGVLSVSVLTGCKKSEEEQAKAVYEEMKKDAKEELERDAELKEERQDTKEALSEKWVPILQEKYDAYFNETDPEKILKHANDYNQAYQEMSADLTDNHLTIHNVSGISNVLMNEIKSMGEIPECASKARSVYFKSSEDITNYENMTCWYSKDTGNIVYALETQNTETGLIENILLVKEDGTKLNLNISDFEKNEYSMIEIYSITADHVIFDTVCNATMYTYVVNISSNEPVLESVKQDTAPGMEHEVEYDFVTDISTVEGLNSICKRMS